MKDTDIAKIKDDYLSMMKELLKDDYENYSSSLTQNHKRGLVLNSSKLNEDDFLNNFGEPIKKLEMKDCYQIESDEKLGNSIFHHAGAIYLQEPSAMVAGFILPLKEGAKVLDACASPGGKTFQISKRLKGVLVSNEIDFTRAKVLSSNVERLGLKNVIVTNFDSEELSNNFINQFDAVLVDAPCSGEGMFRRSSQAIEQWSKDYVDVCQHRQIEIINNIDKTVKVGGYLVYSTCTFNIYENEMVVAELIKKGYKLLPINLPYGKNGVDVLGYDMSKCKRFYPQDNFGEGQFVALLQKETGYDEYKYVKPRYEVLGSIEKKLVKEFCEKFMVNGWYQEVEEKLLKKLDAVFICPNKDFIVDTKKVLNYGVKIGNFVKNRFEPCHNFWTAFGDDFTTQVELTKQEAEAYIRRQVLSTNAPNGWACVKYLGCALAGGKIVNGLIKNHYPKGLSINN